MRGREMKSIALLALLVLLAACSTPTTPTVEVQFTFTPEAPLVHQLVQFTTSTPGPWSWAFGDGGTSAEQCPNHRFAGPKAYAVCLTTPEGKSCQTISVRAI